MDYRNVGASGLRVSAVGLGCNNFGVRLDESGTRAVVHAALDAGITLFDTSDSYGGRGGSEIFLGKALAQRRADVVVATKFASPMDEAGRLQGGSRRYIMQAAEASLKRLGTDWIDLYQFHRPDPLTPMEESLRALDDLVRQGKVRYVGLSNHPAWQVVDAIWISRLRNYSSLVSCQDEYSLLSRGAERELLPMLAKMRLGLLPYFPLAGGMLSGKYKQGEEMPSGSRLSQGGAIAGRVTRPEVWRKTEALRAFAQSHGRSLLELAFSWLAANPIVSSVIAGATSPAQIRANVEAVSWALGPQELAEIGRLA